MISLGIESTAHSFGVGIVDAECRILANEIIMYSPEEGGIHPREAANHHADKAPDVLRKAMEKASISKKDIDVVSFARGPGLGPCLRTGATMARTLSLSLDKPIVGVNHCVAHLEIGRGLFDCKEPVLLYVSGGNTQVIAFANGRYRVFGETLDIGIGNMLDKFGREMGMPFPAGPTIEKMAKEGAEFLDLPYSVKGMDIAFSGILTAALAKKTSHNINDICHTLQETTFAMLVEVTERAMAHLDFSEVLLGGGVAQNKRLQEMVNTMAGERGARMFVPPGSLCTDNGAMIAWTGLLMNKAGVSHKIEETVVDQRFRTDDVDVVWR